MGVMNKLRDNTGVILWILVIAFGVIFMLQDTNMFDALSNNRALNVITVDGEGITQQEYQARVEGMRSQISQQNPDAGPQEFDAADEQAYESLISERLAEREMERLGLGVTDEEVRQLFIGPDPHPIVKAYFPDGQGGVDRAQLQAVIEAPEYEEQLKQLEDYIRSERRQTKLQKLIESMARVSDAEVEAEYRRRSRTVNADVVGLRYASIPDADVTVSDGDLKAYYDAHRDDYAREKTLDLSIVSVTKQATAADTAAVQKELDRIKPSFVQTQNDSTFLADQGSEEPYSGGFKSPSELPPAVASAVLPNPQVGQVVGPVIDNGVAYLIKVRGAREGTETYARARHILISAPEDDANAVAAARTRINELKTQIENGASFEALARQVSQDPGSGQQGGDLGWFERGAMVGPFDEAAFNNPVGALVGPVQTRFGLHLIEVTGKTSQELDVVTFATPIRADRSTLEKARNTLDDFRYFVVEEGTLDQLEAKAQDDGLGYETQTVEIEQQVYPGIGRSSAVRRFLQNADEGDLSDIIELNDRYVMLYVRGVTPEGFRPLDEVREEVRTLATKEKKKAIAVQRLREGLSQGFDGLAARVNGTQASMSSSGQNMFVTGFGPQPRLAGAVAATPQGQTTRVVESQDAAFVARVTSVTEGAPLADEQRSAIRNELLSQRRARILAQFLQGLRDNAEIRDNRASLDS